MGKEEEILESAEKIFVRKGYDGARMQAIADDAKINKAMLHYYFKTKEQLFQKIFLSKISVFMPKVGAIFFSDKDIFFKLDAFIDAYMDLLIAHPNIPPFVINTINKYPGLTRLVPKDVLLGVVGYIDAEIQAGRIKKVEPRQFLVSIISMCVFPFLAKPMLNHVMELEGELYDKFILDRRAEVKNYVRAILKT